MEKPARLSQAFCRTVKEPGRYGDGRGSNGLSLLVRLNARGGLTRSFVQQLRRRDRTTVNLGLGSGEQTTLQQARQKAMENARRLRDGQEVREPRGLPPAKLVPTLRAVAEGWYDLNRSKWKGDGNERLIRQRLENHTKLLLDRRVDAITRPDVLDVLRKAEQGSTRDRCLRYLRSIFDYAILGEWRNDNPADNAVRSALKGSKQQSKHHESIPYGELPGALAEVDKRGGWPITALAVRFVSLTLCRSGEVRGARWDEIDREARLWSIPADRMKSDRAFVVPLSESALEVLRCAEELSDGGDLVFPSTSGNVMNAARLSEAWPGDSTIHGLRSTFRTWAAEQGIDRVISEMVLAHEVGSATELAYQRYDYLMQRVALMERWAAVVEGREPQAKAIALATANA